MATTLTYGYIQPQNGDNGSVWFPALNDNIQQLNDHAHDGVDSALISASDIQKGSVTIASGSWASDGTGRYKQDVTCPSGFNMDDFSVTFRISGDDVIHPGFERLTATTMRVFICDNTLTLTAVFR